MAKSDSFHIKSEQFYILVDKLKSSLSIAVMNTLADNTFKYIITLSNEIVLLITVTAADVLNSSTDSQYNNTEFKGLLHDSGASTWLTGGIDLLKALHQLDISISYNKNIVQSANYTLRFQSTALVG